VSGVRHSARAARRTAAVAAGVGLCALAPLSPPAALAGKDTTTVASPAVAVEVPLAPHARRGDHSARAEGAPPPPAVTPPPPEAAGAGHRHHAQTGAGLLAGQPAEPAATSADGSRHGGGAPPAHGRHRTGAGNSGTSGTSSTSTATGAKRAAAVATGDVSQAAESLARKQKKSGGGGKGGGEKKRRERERERERTQPGETEGSNGQGTGTSGTKGKSTAGTSTATALMAAVPAAVAAPAAASGAASVATAAPNVSPARGLSTGGARVNHAGRAHRRAKRPTTKRSPASATAPVVALAAPAAALATTAPSGSSAGGAHPRSGRGGSYARSSEPAIVHTITRIVDVVPGPVRILIAALAALALAFGLRSLLSGIRTRRLVRQRGELLADVGLLQAALLPDPPARLGPVGTSVAYRPADGPGAGGDFYDVFALEAGQLAVIVGDVSGHGREALPHTALIRFTVRAYLEAGLDPGKALQTAGTVLERQLGGSFATVLAAVYHPRARTLTYAAAGHPPPLVLGEPDASGAASAIAPVTVCSAPPLGAGWRTGTRQSVVAVPGPARLCFHTDGVTEARVGEELFGAERLSRSLAELPEDADAADLLNVVAAQSSARPDDMAACLLHVHGGAGAPAIVAERIELDRDGFDEARVRRFLERCGVTAAAAATSVEQARGALARAGTATVELSYEGGAPVVTVRGENVIHAAALSAVGAT
jgi:hypothetical protein